MTFYQPKKGNSLYIGIPENKITNLSKKTLYKLGLLAKHLPTSLGKLSINWYLRQIVYQFLQQNTYLVGISVKTHNNFSNFQMDSSQQMLYNSLT